MKKIIFALSLLLLCSCSYLDVVPEGKATEEDIWKTEEQAENYRYYMQTYMPNHPAIRYAKAQDYVGFYHYELAERRKALFPPYSLFLRILFSGSDEAALTDAGERYGARLETEIRALLGTEGAQDLLLLVASPAPIRRKQGIYRYQVLIKLLRTKRTAAVIRLVYDFAAARRNELFALLEVNPQDMF